MFGCFVLQQLLEPCFHYIAKSDVYKTAFVGFLGVSPPFLPLALPQEIESTCLAVKHMRWGLSIHFYWHQSVNGDMRIPFCLHYLADKLNA